MVQSVNASAGPCRRRDVYLTLINLGCVYFLVNVSYNGLEALQSTVNAHQGLGTTSVGVLYAALIVSSLLVGPTVVDRLRAKRTLYVTWSANAVFAVANAFPRWETLVPASALVGITMASGNIVYGFYVTGLAQQLSSTTRSGDDDGTSTGARRRRQQNAIVRVNSVLLAFINTGSVVGSLTGSLIIGSGRLSVFSTSKSGVINSTDDDNGLVDVSVCGVGHCPYVAHHIKAFASPDPYLVFVVGAVFLLCVVGAISLTVVLRPLQSDRPCCGRHHHEAVRETTTDQPGKKVSISTRIVATLRLLTDVRLLLLIPTIVLMGALTSFAVGAFNQSFVGCSLGIGMIGYAMIGYRLSYVGASLLAGLLVRCFHRRTLVVVAMLTNIATAGSWFTWTPVSATPRLHVAALMIGWCVLNGVIIGVLRAVFYSLFPLLFADLFDYALAQAAVWDSLGTAVAYFANSHFCFAVKAGVVIALTIVAMVTYCVLEYLVARDSLQQYETTTVERSADAAETTHSGATKQLVFGSSTLASNHTRTNNSVLLLADENRLVVVPAKLRRSQSSEKSIDLGLQVGWNRSV